MMAHLDPAPLAGSMLAAVHGQRTILARSFRLYPKACSRSLLWQHACQDHRACQGRTAQKHAMGEGVDLGEDLDADQLCTSDFTCSR